LKHNLQANIHQSSSTTYDLHALDFIKSLLQACFCQQLQHRQHNSNYTFLFMVSLYR